MIRHVANLLIVAGLSGFVFVEAMPRLPAVVVEQLDDVVTPIVAVLPLGSDDPSIRRPAAQAISGAPITHLAIPSIQLDTAVVPAPLVEHDGASTWSVPRFVAGHAEGSAGPGEPGNAVVIGHVTSLTLGHVFEHLDQVKAGDDVLVSSFERTLAYRVTGVESVDRTAVSVLDATSRPTLTLLTCSGVWLPVIGDYSQRLIVHAELAHF